MNRAKNDVCTAITCYCYFNGLRCFPRLRAKERWGAHHRFITVGQDPYRPRQTVTDERWVIEIPIASPLSAGDPHDRAGRRSVPGAAELF